MISMVEAVRYVGVTVALIGTFITAPSGTKVLFRDGLAALRIARGWVARFIPWLRRSGTVQAVAAGMTWSGGNVTAHGEAWTQIPDGPVEDQIDALRQRTTACARAFRTCAPTMAN